jgi:hypothetical protein
MRAANAHFENPDSLREYLCFRGKQKDNKIFSATPECYR